MPHRDRTCRGAGTAGLSLAQVQPTPSPPRTACCVLLLVQDLHVRIIHATTGELLRELTIDPDRDYHHPSVQPTHPQTNDQLPNTQSWVREFPMSVDITA